MYGDHWKVFFEDEEIRRILEAKFRELESTTFEFKPESLKRFYATKSSRNNFSFPHADSDVYYNHMIVGSDEGVQISNISRAKDRSVGSLVYENDVPAFDISPSNFNLAVASGDDGAYTINLIDSDQDRLVPEFDTAGEPAQIAEQDAFEIEWMFSNIITSNNGSQGVLIETDLPRVNERLDRIERIERYATVKPKSKTLLSNILDTPEGSTVWGARDKLCIASEDIISVYSYKPWKDFSDLDFLGSLLVPERDSEIQRTESANFAFMLQMNSRLHVIQSDGGIFQPADEISNWRNFNRSKNYSNQLHTIFDDRIEILSFNGDYFLNQQEKVIGLYHNPSLTDQKSRRREYYV